MIRSSEIPDPLACHRVGDPEEAELVVVGVAVVVEHVALHPGAGRSAVAWSVRMARSPFLQPFMMNFSMVPALTWKGSGNWARPSTNSILTES